MLKSIAAEREERLKLIAKKGVAAKRCLNYCIKQISDSAIKNKIEQAYEYAKNIEYNHPDLSAITYFLHPLRVLLLTFQVRPNLDTDVYTIALLHNVFEVSNVNFLEIEKEFNTQVAESIKTLTVDRFLGNQLEYKKTYYQNILNSFIGVRVVKIIDKLDNLFLLCLNPDKNTRVLYLKEIENFTIPMCDSDLPELSEYYRDLVKDCREIGFLDKKKSIYYFGKTYV